MSDKTNDKVPSVLYEKDGRIARITLNRPESMNAINSDMPKELKAAVTEAGFDDDIHVIILSGKGRGFCAGYDLKIWAEAKGPNAGSQEMPWDPMKDFRYMNHDNECFLSLWNCPKPVICKIQGFAVAGGSNIALCTDIIIAAEDAKIGYPPARVWGSPTTGMWLYRAGLGNAKRLLLTGDLISGKEAYRMGIVNEAVPIEQLDETVETYGKRMASISIGQLMMHKMLINQTFANMGMQTTQTLATLFDGVARHNPEGVAFKKRCEAVGFKQAVKERDSGEPIPEKS